MRLGPGGHMGETIKEEKGPCTPFCTVLPLVNPSAPHKVAPGTNFSAMKYYPYMMFPTPFPVAF